MAQSNSVVCPSCGFTNPLPLPKNRCVSCGAKVEDRISIRPEDIDRRYKQGRFSAAWFGISVLIIAVLTVAIVLGLPMVVPLFDFEGQAGMMVSIPVWFVAGVLIGLISPGRTFVEPVVATFLVAMPTAFILYQNQTVKTMPAFMYVLMATLGLVFALIGSYTGERIQMGPTPKATD